MSFLSPGATFRDRLAMNPTTDSSSISTFLDCRRKFFYAHVLGWKNTGDERNDLVFGSAYHKAMEVLMQGDLNNDAIVIEAYDVFLKAYREFYSAETDIYHKNKNPASALAAFMLYQATYKNHPNAELLYTEIAGSVPVNIDQGERPRFVHFRMDAVLRDKRGVFFRDFKTASTDTRAWRDQWALSNQMHVYNHVLACLFPNAKGGEIDAMFFSKTGQVHGYRIPFQRTPDAMLEFLVHLNHYMDLLDWDLTQLAEAKQEERYMQAFPRNTNSCTKYFGCPYMSFCLAWPNPLKNIDEPPVGFKIDYWDPRKEDATANKIFNVEKMPEGLVQ